MKIFTESEAEIVLYSIKFAPNKARTHKQWITTSCEEKELIDFNGMLTYLK